MTVRRTFRRRLLAASMLTLFASTAAAAGSADTLFSIAPQAKASVAASDDRVLQAIQAEPASRDLVALAVEATHLDEAVQHLDMEIAPGVRVQAEQQYAYTNPDGTIVWSGTLNADDTRARLQRFGEKEALEDPDASVLVVRNGDRLTGTIRSGGEIYQLRPLADGGHVLTRMDTASMPPDHPAGHRHTPIQPLVFDHLEIPENKNNTVVRVGVLISNAAASAIGDITGFANLAVAESNQGFANSGAQVTLQLAHVGTTTYTGTNFSTALDHFRGTSDGFMDGWHATRNSTAADLSVLVINNSASCGIGYLNASAAYAFSVVHYGCATGYYTFAHEIGHNFGAHHNPEIATNNAYPYGHGYRHPGSAFRTIMAYNCSPGCTRVNYWSNRSRTYNGAPMGTAATHDNARVINNRRATVAGFR